MPTVVLNAHQNLQDNKQIGERRIITIHFVESVHQGGQNESR